MKQELVDIITRLEKDPTRLLTVIDTQSFRPILSSWSAERISQKYGSVVGFFETLVSQGTITIVVEERRKHGSSSIAVGERKTFTLIPKNPPMETQNTPEQPPVLPTATPPVASPIVPQPTMTMPLNGLAGFGLGFPELVGLHVSAHEKVRLETENKFYKEENERLKNEVAELKEERLKNQYSEAKARGNMDTFKAFIPHLAGIFQAFKGGGVPAGGLSSPETALPEISPEKAQLFEQFSQTSPEIDAFISAVLHGVFTNEAFYQDLTQLLEKHQLIEN